MQEEAKIRFYKIEACGYYKPSEGSHLWGDTLSTLTQLQAYTTGKNIEDTQTYIVKESDDLTPAYCFNIHKDTHSNDFIVSLWNELPTTEGEIPTVKKGSKVGKAKVDLNAFDDESIPGVASYFWFMPDEQIFATIRFNHTSAYLKNLKYYIKSYLKKYSPHVVVSSTVENPFYIDGYAKTSTDHPIHTDPRFNCRMVRSAGKIDQLYAKRSKIKKLIRKEILKKTIQHDKTFWTSLTKGLLISNQPDLHAQIPIKYEIPYCPTKIELDGIIGSWEESHDAKWDDIGFIFSGESDPLWLSYSLAKEKIKLEIERTNPEVVVLSSLLEALKPHRNRLLRLAKKQ